MTDRYRLLMREGLIEEAEAWAKEELQMYQDWDAFDERELERKKHAGPRAAPDIDGEYGPSDIVRRWEQEREFDARQESA